MCAGDGSPFCYQAEMRTLCPAAAGNRSYALSLSIEIAPLFQLQPSKRGAVARRSSFLTLRDKTSVMGIAAWRFAPNEGGGFATALQGAARGSKAGLVGNVHLEPGMSGRRLGSLGPMRCNFGIRAKSCSLVQPQEADIAFSAGSDISCAGRRRRPHIGRF